MAECKNAAKPLSSYSINTTHQGFQKRYTRIGVQCCEYTGRSNAFFFIRVQRTLKPSPYGKKNPNLLKSWGIKKGQLLAQYTIFFAGEYLERRCRAHSGGLRPAGGRGAFGKIIYSGLSVKNTVKLQWDLCHSENL